MIKLNDINGFGASYTEFDEEHNRVYIDINYHNQKLIFYQRRTYIIEWHGEICECKIVNQRIYEKRPGLTPLTEIKVLLKDMNTANATIILQRSS